MIIAVDFDGTLCQECFPEIGEANTRLINDLIRRKTLGDKVILWTCREGQVLLDAINWCKLHGLIFDAINDNIPEVIEQWGSNSRKITADVYIDDKSQRPNI